MEWFKNTFLQSLFDRIGTGKDRWLTVKQTAICTQYMEKNTITFSDGFASYNHDNYVIEWNGRQVYLSYSKKNGCGLISFGLNEDEKAENSRKTELERIEIIRERAARTYRRNPERYQEHIRKLSRRIEEIKQTIEEEKEDGATQEDLVPLYTWMDEIDEELKIYKVVCGL